jgi:glycine cleavage system H lipoate-binding protein
MSVLLVLLMFALAILWGRLFKREVQPSAAVPEETLRRFRPRIESKFEMEVPRSYFFHPCHTWAVDEGFQLIRVGVDSFTANLFGKIEHIDVAGLYGWVRQGQKLMTISGGGIAVDLPSPIEGVLTAVNRAVLDDPAMATTDPYGDGWVAVIRSPSFGTDRKNLMQGAMVAPWMRNSIVQLREMCSPSGALAQDGGPPLPGLLNRVSPELRNRVIREFFLTLPVVPAEPTNQHV